MFLQFGSLNGSSSTNYKLLHMKQEGIRPTVACRLGSQGTLNSLVSVYADTVWLDSDLLRTSPSFVYLVYFLGDGSVCDLSVRRREKFDAGPYISACTVARNLGLTCRNNRCLLFLQILCSTFPNVTVTSAKVWHLSVQLRKMMWCQIPHPRQSRPVHLQDARPGPMPFFWRPRGLSSHMAHICVQHAVSH